MNPLTFTTTRGKAKRVVDVPLPDADGMPLVDTHAHLDLLDNPALALARAAVAGLSHVMTIADVAEDAARTYNDLADWQASAQLLLDEHAPLHASRPTPRVPEVGIIVGIHPHNARHFNADTEAAIRAFAHDPRTRGMGELGLDFHYDHSPRACQREVFARSIALATELNLPITIHLREAHDEGLDILREVGVPPAGAILHCFNREYQVAEPFMALGCHVSFAGPVTFKRADEVRDSAARVPADRLLVETDCPFMAPEPFRGHPCEPAYTLWNAATVAAARREPLAHVARATTTAALKLFGYAEAATVA
ncbi:MAG: TatD family hydrolase [Actinomycetes bacterium]|jgi:TatD DNase family protein|nr:TatD family hydrolase [Actinomycetes bacterium]